MCHTFWYLLKICYSHRQKRPVAPTFLVLPGRSPAIFIVQAFDGSGEPPPVAAATDALLPLLLSLLFEMCGIPTRAQACASN